jgi:hypothetical protein
MHRLSRFSPFKKAREQGNFAPGESGSGEAEGAMAPSADSDRPAGSQAKGATTESNIDVSVLAKTLPLELD